MKRLRNIIIVINVAVFIVTGSGRYVHWRRIHNILLPFSIFVCCVHSAAIAGRLF